METRKIVIVDSASNQKVVVDTDATNFGELKRAARAAGIDYEGKDWLEGITKTSPMADDSLLPTNVSYKGTITNNLVYMLTNTNKKIRSGMDRSAIYVEIKKLGLAEEVKKTYGKNYTQVSSANLLSVIEKAQKKTAKKDSNVAAPAIKAAEVRKEMENSCSCEERYGKIVKALARFISLIPKEVLDDASKEAKKLTPEVSVEEVSFSDADLNNLFK